MQKTNMVNPEQYQYNRRVESIILPKLKDLSPTKRDKMRTYIRNAKSQNDLQQLWPIFAENGITIDFEEVVNEVSEIMALKEQEADKAIIDEIYYLISEKKTRNSGIWKLAKYLINKNNLFTFSDTDEIFYYDAVIYKPSGEKILHSQIQDMLGELCNINVVNETLAHIKRLTYKKREDVKEPTDKLCLLNGILNFKTLTVIDHTPDIFFFSKINAMYSPEANCNLIMKFLNEIVAEDDILILQEMLGYCLYKGYPMHKAFMLVGGGSNGKSTLLNLLKTFLGQENCCAVPLQQLESNIFSSSALFGKLANLFADLPTRALKETSMFKMLVGEDLIPAERKFKDKFFFSNYAKLIFSANQIPKSPEDTDAFFRRWIIINFPNQFLNAKADKHLIKKLTTEEELSGFLNFALEGLKSLISNGEFSNTKSIEQIRQQYIRQSDSVHAFRLDRIRVKPDDHVIKKEIYTAYCDYCRLNKYPIVAENTFHRELQTHVRVEDYRPLLEIDGKKQRVQCWKGISYVKSNLNVDENPDSPDSPDTSIVNHVNDVKDISYFKEKK